MEQHGNHQLAAAAAASKGVSDGLTFAIAALGSELAEERGKTAYWMQQYELERKRSASLHQQVLEYMQKAEAEAPARLVGPDPREAVMDAVSVPLTHATGGNGQFVHAPAAPAYDDEYKD